MSLDEWDREKADVNSKQHGREDCVSIPLAVEPIGKIPIPPQLDDILIEQYPVKDLSMSIRGSKHDKIHDSRKDGV